MIRPHGSGELKPLYIEDPEQNKQLQAEAESLPSLLLNSAAAANAVMLGAGYFNPLPGYMNLDDALSTAQNMHTTKNLFWPVPILNLTTDISAIHGVDRIALRDPNVNGNPIIAVQDIESVETMTEDQQARITEKIFGTLDGQHQDMLQL